MKTSEKSVVVEVKIGGKLMRHTYPIATNSGDLMTHRLKRLMAGNVGRSRGPHGGYEETHFVGMIWKPPYLLIQEILRDRMELQDKLRKLEGKSNFTEAEPATIPDRAENGKITTMIQNELRFRDSLKARIAAIQTTFTPSDEVRPIGPPYGGWSID